MRRSRMVVSAKSPLVNRLSSGFTYSGYNLQLYITFGSSMTASALDGIVVLDLTRMLPGPYASMVLADLGAEAIEIEDAEHGDPTRVSPPILKNENSAFLTVNRGKKSLALNLKSPEGVEIFRKLVLSSDIVLEGYRPGVMDRLGIDSGTRALDRGQNTPARSPLQTLINAYAHAIGCSAARATHPRNSRIARLLGCANRSPRISLHHPGVRLEKLKTALVIWPAGEIHPAVFNFSSLTPTFNVVAIE